MAEVPIEGHSGGIAIFWTQDVLQVEVVATTHQEIHCVLQVIPQPHKWMFSDIYASPNSHNCTILWDNLRCIDNAYKGPWLLAGDFNKILRSSGKFGGRSINFNRTNKFLDCIN